MPDPILTNLISSALYDTTRFGLDKALKKDIEHLFQQALKDCSREYKPEVAGRLRNVFKRKELKEKLLRFQEWGELIPEAAFVEAFSKILGGAGNAREFVEEFFQHFSARLAGHNKLFRQVVLGYQRNLLAGQGELRAQLQTHDQASQEGQARILQLLEDLIARIDPSLLREDTAEATIGYQEIPPLPPAYVPPETALQALRTRLQQRSVALVYGPPGAGKSVIATALAREAEAAGRPVFWFRFQRLLTDRKAVERSLLGFLKQETQHPTSNIQHLLSKSRALLIFDDLQYVADEELQKFLHLVAALAAERDPARGSLIFTSREKADYLPNAKLSELPVAGLAEAEAFAEGRKIRVTKVPFSATPKALINNDPRGFVKIISDPATGVVLGGSIVGRHAAELISVIALAVTANLKVTDIVESLLVHPALAEALAEAAE